MLTTFALACAATTGVVAQTAPVSMTLEQALASAAEHHPSLVAAQQQAAATEGDVTVARSAYLPRLDAVWQSNRATVNNVFGQLLPQSVVPPISGPVLDRTSSAGVWGSAVGGLLTWEPVDFGQRAASTRAADQGLARARANESLTRLDLQSAAAARFLRAASAALEVEVAEADVARRDVLVRITTALVNNQLRAGADLSRADAQRAAAQTHLIQAREAAAIARIELARAVGISGEVTIQAGAVIDRLPVAPAAAAAAATPHPLALLQDASLDLARARADSVRLSMRPKFLLQTSLSARGSGAALNGIHDGGIGGLALDRTNWAGGMQIMFPNLFEWRAQQARSAAAQAAVRAEAARRDDALLGLTAQQHIAAARFDAARAIADNTPAQLAAARQSESQSRARYDAGLASILEVVDAQSLLARAEYEHRVARINAWLALLDIAVAHGDLAPFIDAVHAAAGGQ